MSTGNNPMNCGAFAESLADYLAGELDDATRAAAESHLAACPACRDQAASLARARATLQRLVIHAEHAEARTADLALPSPAPLATLPFRGFARPFAAAAALALAFTLGYSVRGGPSAAPQSPVAGVSLADSYTLAARTAPDSPTLTQALLSIARH